MLRISKVESAKPSVTLRIEGQIVGPWVDELRQTTERLLVDGCSPILDLTEITFADRNGVELLLNLQERAVAIKGASPFLTEQLKKAVGN